MKNYLNFETEVKNLEDELENLKDPYNQSGLSEVDTKKISETQDALNEKLKFIYSKFDDSVKKQFSIIIFDDSVE